MVQLMVLSPHFLFLIKSHNGLSFCASLPGLSLKIGGCTSVSVVFLLFFIMVHSGLHWK